MTPQDEARIYELPRLIAEEADPKTVTELADELGRLLSGVGQPWPIDEKPAGS